MCSINATVARQQGRKEETQGVRVCWKVASFMVDKRIILSGTGNPQGTSIDTFIFKSSLFKYLHSMKNELKLALINSSYFGDKLTISLSLDFTESHNMIKMVLSWHLLGPVKEHYVCRRFKGHSYQDSELSTEQLRAQRLLLRLESDNSFFKTRFLEKTGHSRWSQAGN